MSELILFSFHFKTLLKICHGDIITLLHTQTDFAICCLLEQLFSTLRQEFWNKEKAKFYNQDILLDMERVSQT